MIPLVSLPQTKVEVNSVDPLALDIIEEPYAQGLSVDGEIMPLHSKLTLISRRAKLMWLLVN